MHRPFGRWTFGEWTLGEWTVATIVFLAALFSLSLVGCESQGSETYPASESTTTFEVRNQLVTVRHDGHLFVVYRVDSSPDRPGGPLHHPSCDHEDCASK
jgi:hypothetical protein